MQKTTTQRPGVVGYVFGEICKQNCDVESDVFGWAVKPICELVEVYLTILVGINTHHHVVDLLTVRTIHPIPTELCLV